MSQHHVTVYVGDVTEYLSSLAHRHDDAKHITSCNRQNLKPGVYYTSIGDLDSLVHFGEILQQADEIVYAPPDCWSDGGQMKRWAEDYLQVFACDPDKTVKGLVLEEDELLYDACLHTVGQRAADGKQIWIAGCSISHGIGVEIGQRYGDIIANRLELPVTYLTYPGSSIPWAADQILRSDIRNGDKIFWGITNPSRFTYWDDIDKNVKYSAIINWDRHKHRLNSIIKKNFLASDHVIYHSTLAVRQVVNFCAKINAELVIGTVAPGMEFYLRGIKNFMPMFNICGREKEFFLDVGNDNQHPGVLTHEFYAKCMLKKYAKVYGVTNKI